MDFTFIFPHLHSSLLFLFLFFLLLHMAYLACQHYIVVFLEGWGECKAGLTAGLFGRV